MHPINLAPYKNLFNANNTTVTVAIYDKYGDVRDATIKVRLITIALTERESTLIPATTNTLQFKCNLIGGTSGVSNKKLTYTFYKEEDLEDYFNNNTKKYGTYQAIIIQFNTLTEAKKAMEATIEAHVDGGVPNMILEMEDMSEYEFGYLVYFLEKACAVSGYILGVNPFNQPGVESYKKNMFALLGKPGYEAEREALLERIK
mgnify:CR=1 FL=1